MKYITLLFLSLNYLNQLHACDCKGLTIEEGYNSSTAVVLGEIIRAEQITYIIDKVSKDSIQNQYDRLLSNDTINFMEYTVQIIKNYKSTQEIAELTIRAEANGSNCDIRLKVGNIYMIYGQNNWWANLYYPNDKYFVLSSICTRTTSEWKREQKDLEKYLKKMRQTSRNTR